MNELIEVYSVLMHKENDEYFARGRSGPGGPITEERRIRDSSINGLARKAWEIGWDIKEKEAHYCTINLEEEKYDPTTDRTVTRTTPAEHREFHHRYLTHRKVKPELNQVRVEAER